MQDLDWDDATTDWARDCPTSIATSECHGSDDSCGGKSLADACEQCAIDPHYLIEEIRTALVDRENESTQVTLSLGEISNGGISCLGKNRLDQIR